MSNLKKNILYGLIFLCFLMLGIVVSRAQADKAELTLATNGLSTSAREISHPRNLTAKKFLQYVSKNYHNKNVQIQFTDATDSNQILVWANFDLTELPIEKGRYLMKSDFDGQIPFALYTTNSDAQVEEVQNNQYILYNGTYISVVGSLKDGYLNDNNYLTTGIKQSTNRFNLQNYTIIIDGLSKAEYRNVARYVSGTAKQPSFIKKAISKQNNPVLLFILSVCLIIISAVITIFLGLVARKTSKDTALHDRLFKNLQINLAIRFAGFSVAMAIGALIISYYFFYYSQISQLVWLLIFVLLLLNINFDFLVLSKQKHIK